MVVVNACVVIIKINLSFASHFTALLEAFVLKQRNHNCGKEQYVSHHVLPNQTQTHIRSNLRPAKPKPKPKSPKLIPHQIFWLYSI